MEGKLGVALVACAAIWVDIPFVKQEKNGCGAACISMVMQYWGRTPRVPARTGWMVAADMERYFQEEGFRTFAFRGEWDDLAQHLSKGRPLIVGLGKHYVVVAGIDGELVLVNDPAQRKLLRMDRKRFEQGWDTTGRWTLLVLPWPEP